MKTTWDYSELAATYDKRADYPEAGIDLIAFVAGLRAGSRVADLGAGTGKLCLKLLRRGYRVDAVEPNDAMRGFGERNTAGLEARWSEGTGEASGLEGGRYDLVSFGSSFNVTRQGEALQETRRLLKPRGWFTCMWNHRDVEDPIQARVQQAITKFVPNYSHGNRREDQTGVIEGSRLFGTILSARVPFEFVTSREDYVDAWRSHATLQRQAGDAFPKVIEAIQAETPAGRFAVPYHLALWLAQARD